MTSTHEAVTHWFPTSVADKRPSAWWYWGRAVYVSLRGLLAGYPFTPDVVSGAEIEMEHLRAPNRCPSGTRMAGVFLWDTPGNCRLEADDESLKRELFQNAAAWNIGIAQFPPGRLCETTALRKFLPGWGEPLEPWGDYLDRLSSEAAVRTGKEAAARLAQKTENDLSEIGGAVSRRAPADRAPIYGERGACGSALRELPQKASMQKRVGETRGPRKPVGGISYSRESRALLLCSRSPDRRFSELDAMMCSR